MGFCGRGDAGSRGDAVGGGWALWGVMGTAATAVILQVALLRNSWAAHLLGGVSLVSSQIWETFLFGATAVFAGQILVSFQSKQPKTVPPMRKT
jgi:hypothetical protein